MELDWDGAVGEGSRPCRQVSSVDVRLAPGDVLKDQLFYLPFVGFWEPSILELILGWLMRTEHLTDENRIDPWIDQIIIPSGNHPNLPSPWNIPDFKLLTNLIFTYNLDIYFAPVFSWERWYVVPNLRSSFSPWRSLGDMEKTVVSVSLDKFLPVIVGGGKICQYY